MRSIGCRVALLGLVVVATAAGAEAQTAPRPRARSAGFRAFAGYVSLNAGAQMARASLDPTFAFPLYREDARVATDYDTPASLLFDVGAGVRVWQRLGVGAALTRSQETGAAAIHATLPHPLFLSRNREIDDTIPDLERVETAAHIQISWLVPATERVTVAVFGGPTIFRLEQDVVTGLNLAETYPYDDVQLASATQARREETAVGFHAGADVMYRISRTLGVGAVARYTRGTVTIATDADEQADVTAGGLQLTGGVRWFF